MVKDLSTKENILTRSVIQDKVSSMSFDSLFIALWLDHRSIPLHPSLPPMAQVLLLPVMACGYGAT